MVEMAVGEMAVVEMAVVEMAVVEMAMGEMAVGEMAVGEMAVVGVYVDDILVACKSKVKMKEVKQSLCRKFDVKDLGKLRHF